MNASNPASGGEIPPPAAMLQIIAGFWVSRSVYIAATLGIADMLKDGPRSSTDLAHAAGIHAPSLYRLMRALASVGVFIEVDGGRFGLTPLASTLLSDVPGSLRAYVIHELGGHHYPAWAEAMHSIKTGDIAFDHLYGMSVWLYRSRQPADAQIFDTAMASFSSILNAEIVAAYDFSPLAKIVDVGGGDGGLLATILKAYPRIQGVLFDMPNAVARAQPRIERELLTGRCEIVAGDFFESVPPGASAYLLKWVIHDWDDARSVAILENCRRAMAADGKLLLIEAIIPPGNAPSFYKFMDLNMMVMNGGRERTQREYQTLLEMAGYRLTRTISMPSGMSVIEGAVAR